MLDPSSWLMPDWRVTRVSGAVSLRLNPSPSCPWGAFNTADHVGDDASRVQASRETLRAQLNTHHSPVWLDQAHGTRCVDVSPDTPRQEADAVYTTHRQLPITIHTADCLPVFLASRQGDEIALAHAGWRGLQAGVIESALTCFASSASDLVAWLGPAIGPDAFEVGDEVRDAFLSHSAAHGEGFRRGTQREGRQYWWCNLYHLARQRLAAAGVTCVTGGHACTFSDPRFFSYRRDRTTGRMLSILWLE